jgi:hypothetical protein
MEYPKIVYVEAVLMENGELIHYGQSLGFINARQKKLVESDGAAKLAKGGETIVAIGKNNVA